MYAVIKTGGKQYRVQKGDIINVEKITLPKANQKTIKFDEVLLLNDDKTTMIGTPVVKNAQVEAKIIDAGKLDKVIIYKYKSKKDYRKKQGHRQPYMQLEITKVGMKAAKKKADEETSEEVQEA
ncbi:MAG: 50S ribosomal protein L21 [Anaerofustis sp.]